MLRWLPFFVGHNSRSKEGSSYVEYSVSGLTLNSREPVGCCNFEQNLMESVYISIAAVAEIYLNVVID